ncbi:uncharacterized protein BKCO1_2700021 [Diplodia corticola]|uniref:Uncharacterized protein n=1 Tax=Diplodia corticola TaxID=236234 RepID=A0A1J9S2A9_9PEZI|nr:uncharacterized protein BKCO1_2700021 [Diplodia corticola]OJD33781.1 hypothetical protein BKCO1_2700021 [Diplodia corticola]
MAPPNLVFATKKAQLRDRLKRQIHQKQKELRDLEIALGKLDHNPQQSNAKAMQAPPPPPLRPGTAPATVLASNQIPLTLNLTPHNLSTLLLPQLRACRFVFTNRFHILQRQDIVYAQIEELLKAIVRKASKSADEEEEEEEEEEERTNGRRKKKRSATAGIEAGDMDMPLLLRVEEYTDEELEPLARLKGKIECDHEALRELQRRGKGWAGVLEEVKAGLERLLGMVGGTEDDQEGGDIDRRGGGRDDVGGFGRLPQIVSFIPRGSVHQVPSPEPSPGPDWGESGMVEIEDDDNDDDDDDSSDDSSDSDDSLE